MTSRTTFDTCGWWSEEALIKGLHTLLDPVRVPLFAETLFAAGSRKVLDIGCGGGFVTSALRNRGFDVTGVDISEAAVAAARAHDHGPFTIGDAHHLPFGPRTFDAVICSEVLEHVARPEQVIAESARILEPGGVFVFSTPNRTWLSWLVLIGLAERFWPTRVLPPHLHEWRSFLTPAELTSALDAHGLCVEWIRGIRLATTNLPSAIIALLRLRMGRITHAEAGRRIRLVSGGMTAVSYMGLAVKK